MDINMAYTRLLPLEIALKSLTQDLRTGCSVGFLEDLIRNVPLYRFSYQVLLSYTSSFNVGKSIVFLKKYVSLYLSRNVSYHLLGPSNQCLHSGSPSIRRWVIPLGPPYMQKRQKIAQTLHISLYRRVSAQKERFIELIFIMLSFVSSSSHPNGTQDSSGS